MNTYFTRSGSSRRGMLLLLVMLMLSLFMAIGAWLLTITLRSRASARAYGTAALETTGADNLAKQSLDESLLRVLRGGTDGSVTVSGTLPALENLLADKYGPPLISGSGVVQSGTGTPVLTLTLTGSGLGGIANRLGGRILTLSPNPSDGDISSFRILGGIQTGTTGSTAECYLANLPATPFRKLPTGTAGFFINGREFTPTTGTTGPESYDAYDDANIWLAQPLLALGQVSRFDRLSFSGTAGTAVVDNDNDGVLDGAWIPPDASVTSAIASGTSTPAPFVIPDRPSPLGGTLRFQVSYLILDLDGRININAAGMATSQSSYAGTPNTPIGMGYGPADINSPLLFPPTLPTDSGTYAFSGVWPELLLSGTPTTTAAAPTATQRRSPPIIGAIDGRYGTNATPEAAGDQTAVNQQTSTGTNAILNTTTGGTDSIYTLTIAGSNAVADLKGQTRIYMTAPSAGQLTPTLNFYRPSWSGTAGSDSIDDPYETRLDSAAPRFGDIRRPAVAAGANDDNPFTLAELERVLRANDPDAPQLPQRLASGLEDLAQRSRMTITTDSWDTPGLTGLAARQIEDFIAASGTSWGLASNVMSPDIAAGLRFNINRPVLSGTTAVALAQQQEYCKGLYTLVRALGGISLSPAEAAQWAANVLDFRDADAALTRFVYDTDLSNGWQITASSPVVYGAERPEVVITETAAWRDLDSNQSQLFVNLHRPAASAVLIAATTGSTTVVGQTEVSGLAMSGTLPLAAWQLRYTENNAVAFASVGTSGTTQSQFVLSGTSVTTRSTNLSGSSLGVPAGLASPGAGAGDYLCVLPNSPQNLTATALPMFTVDQGNSFRFTSSATPPVLVSGTVVLERLADPSQPNGPTNPYVAMDTAVLTETPPSALRKNRRTGPQDSFTASPLAVFWRQLPWQSIANTSFSTYVTGATYTGSAVSTGTAPVPWFHWPNRPFISQAELALVPTGSSSTDGVLANYSFPTNSLATSTTSIAVSSTTSTLGSLILDATYVPSRFAENAVTITGTSINALINALGLDKLQAHHFSKWREPGKVNVNTIVSGTTTQTGTTASLDDIVWATLIGNTYVANPFIPAPARGPTSAIPATTAIPATRDRPAIPAIPATPTQPNGTPIQPAMPAQSIAGLLALSGTGGPISTQEFTSAGTEFFPRDKNPYFSYSQSIRLANTATIRSQVFAVWITVKITDDSPNAPSPVTRRMFAIIDRSIPVGYAPGQDLNVRDTIRLKRYLD